MVLLDYKIGNSDIGSFEAATDLLLNECSFFIIPTKKGKTVIFNL